MSQILLDLIDQPLVNNLCASSKEALEAERFPLKAIYKEDLTIHLGKEVKPSKLYAHYLYRSGVNIPYIEHCKQMFASLKHLKMETVIDIGGNDGTLLSTFKNESRECTFWSHTGIKRLINVDMSQNLQSENEKKGIEYVCGQFNDEMDLPKADLIISTNVFQHTKDIHAFMRGISKFLDGLWVLEFPYTLTTLQTLQFDQFYHEHYYYWLISPLEQLFKEYGLKIIFVQEQSIHGGSMRLWMTNKALSPEEIAGPIASYKEKEKALDFASFNKNCWDHMSKAKDFLASLKGRTAFFGAAAKGCVFLNALELTVNSMPDSFVIDDTKAKQGLFVPGTGFEVVNRSCLDTERIDNIVILAHNFADYIAKSFDNKFNGKMYTLLPIISEVAA
jgi:hypothetical protein